MSTDGLRRDETTANDLELLRQYAMHNAVVEFTSLVKRQVKLVYSGALRQSAPGACNFLKWER